MRPFIKLTLMIVAGLIGMTDMLAFAQPRTIAECSQKLTARGFIIADKENNDDLYEFEAIKNNQKWDIKMDQTCNILLERTFRTY